MAPGVCAAMMEVVGVGLVGVSLAFKGDLMVSAKAVVGLEQAYDPFY